MNYPQEVIEQVAGGLHGIRERAEGIRRTQDTTDCPCCKVGYINIWHSAIEVDPISRRSFLVVMEWCGWCDYRKRCTLWSPMDAATAEAVA